MIRTIFLLRLLHAFTLLRQWRRLRAWRWPRPTLMSRPAASAVPGLDLLGPTTLIGLAALGLGAIAEPVQAGTSPVSAASAATTERATAAPAIPSAPSASSASSSSTDVDFATYLDAIVRTSNDLAAQREAVSSARAGVGIAGLRPDPSLSLGAGPIEFSREVNPKPRLAQSIGLSYTVETGGKRERRIAVANSQVKVSEVALEGVKRQAFSDAADAFIETCRTREALERQEASLKALSDIVRMNELRHRAGDLGGLELLQSRNERDQFLATVVKARADARAALEGLSAPLGRRWAETFGARLPACDFQAGAASEDVDGLVARAMDERDDVRAARAALDAARAAADLTRANRKVDPSVSLSYGYTPQGRRGIGEDGSPTDPTPRSNTLSVSLSVPIPLSRLDKGDLVQAESAVTQAMLALRQTELKAQADVRVTFAQYNAALENLTRYRDSTLGDADKVLDGMRTSYKHGSASLLELLSAQRAADDTHLAYLQARSDLATATVKLQLSLGRQPQL